MEVTTNVADFKLLSRELQRNNKLMSIYQYSIQDDLSCNKNFFFITVICESLSKNV